MFAVYARATSPSGSAFMSASSRSLVFISKYVVSTIEGRVTIAANRARSFGWAAARPTGTTTEKPEATATNERREVPAGDFEDLEEDFLSGHVGDWPFVRTRPVGGLAPEGATYIASIAVPSSLG